MEISQACFRIAIHLQEVIIPPVQVTNISPVKLSVVSSFFKEESRPRKIWRRIKLVLLLIIVFSLYRIATLFRHWEEGNNAQQMCVYTTVATTGKFARVAFDTIEFNGEELAFALGQSMKLVNFHPWSSPWSRIPGTTEAVAYVFCFTFGTIFILCAFCLPVVDYHPVQLVTEWFLNYVPFSRFYPKLQIIVDVFSSLSYGVAAIHGTFVCLFLFFGVVIFAEAIQVASFGLIPGSKFKRSIIGSDMICNRVYSTSDFSQQLKLYRCIQILIRAGNQVVADFLQAVLLTGVILATCSGYVGIKLYDSFPTSVYIFGSLILPVCVILDLVLFTLAAIPSENVSRFMQIWKRHLTTKFDRLQLMSC